MNPELINTAVGFLTLLAQIGAIVLAIAVWKFPKSDLVKFVGTYALWIGFGIAFAAMAGSLVYSEILDYPPCDLCWYQRIFIYSLAFLFGHALLKNERVILPYAMTLAIPGALLAFYHHLVQFSFVPSIPCGATAVSCSVRFFLEFGYITFPLASFTAFAIIILTLIAAKRTS